MDIKLTRHTLELAELEQENATLKGALAEAIQRLEYYDPNWSELDRLIKLLER